MNNHQVTVIGVVLIAILVLFAITTFQQQAQDNTQQRAEDPPTPVQLGVISEKQKKNSKRYNRPNSDSLVNENRNVGVIIGRPFAKEDSSNNFIPSQQTHFQKLACQADTIVIGKVKSKNSQLSEDNTSVFTDYQIEVNTILKTKLNNILPNNLITVTRSGGRVKFNNHLIEVIDKSYKQLKIGGEYLIFLNYLNDSDSFAASSDEGTFEIQGNKFKRFKDDKNIQYQSVDEDLNNLNTYISEISSQCSE